MRCVLVLGAVLAGLADGAAAQDAPPAPAPGDVAPAMWLVVEAPDHSIRRTMSPSAVFARHLLDRDAPPPKEGDEITGERGVPVKWTSVAAKDGGVDSGTVAWAYGEVESPEERVVLADLDGGLTLWVNGDPVAGDAYSYGLGGFPAVLRKGTNRLYVAGIRGGFKLALRPVREGVHAVAWDVVKPDVERGEALGAVVSVTIVNAAREPARDVPYRVLLDGKDVPSAAGTHDSDALAAWRRRIAVDVPAAATSDPARKSIPLVVEVGAGSAASRVEIPLEIRGVREAQRVTFRSEIDGTLQQYAVVPPPDSTVGGWRTAALHDIVLSLHGAGVDCLDQARAYSPEPHRLIFCPTNRRPFGFDWQDWGRRDAYEVLAAELGRHPDRPREPDVFLTGHSMGGHGTWHLAANDPDRFLAIAPSAGWASFDTYPVGRRPDSALSDLWRGADGASDTLALVGNLAPIPTFVLHGTADDNVPVAQAETMLAALRAAGGGPRHRFQKGAGHWWDGDVAPGADCVDWPEISGLFTRSSIEAFGEAGADGDRVASGARSATWTTVDPSVDSQHFGWRILQPLVYGRPSRLRADLGGDPSKIETENVARLEQRDAEGKWTPVDLGGGVPSPLDPVREKTPWRSGPMKRAFDRRMLAVLPADDVGAHVTEIRQQHRMDLAQWWIRANGVIPRVLDTQYPGAVGDGVAGRNLLLYGNADVMKPTWSKIVAPDCPIEVRAGFVRVGDRIFRGDGIACFFVRPRADDDAGVVGVLGSTGPRGARLAMTHSLFTSGTGWPDYVVWDERALTLGDGGVLAAGWFDAKWRLDGRGFIAWGGEVVR